MVSQAIIVEFEFRLESLIVCKRTDYNGEIMYCKNIAPRSLSF